MEVRRAFPAWREPPPPRRDRRESPTGPGRRSSDAPPSSGRRLAIKPHTAVVAGVAGVGPGSLNPGAMPGGGAMRGGGGVYYHTDAVGGRPGMAPGAHPHAGVLGQRRP